MSTRIGTCYFVSRQHAVAYYAQQDTDAAEVDRKIADKEIVVGAELPAILPGDEHDTDADGRRWIIEPYWLTPGAPNLDAMPESEVQAFAERIRCGITAMSLRLFANKSRIGSLAATDKLQRYATTTSRAMWHRLRGNIQQATAHESDCEQIYNSLPKWARW